MKYLKPFDSHISENSRINEDWGSSDQSIMNQSVHKDLGNPKEMPMLNDILSAVESAVDFYWDEWEEYSTDRDGLIKHAFQMYMRAYFPKEFEGFKKMLG